MLVTQKTTGSLSPGGVSPYRDGGAALMLAPTHAALPAACSSQKALAQLLSLSLTHNFLREGVYLMLLREYSWFFTQGALLGLRGTYAVSGVKL